MTEGSIAKSLLLFAVPLILGNLLQQLYNTADSIIVGNFVGANALAAVGSSGSPIYLLIGFSQGVAVGAGVVVAQYLGAKDRVDTQLAVHTALAISVVMGLILTIGGVACGRVLLEWMNTPAEVLEDAVTYIRIYFGGVLFSVVYNMIAGILNAAGNSRRSLVYLAYASLTNILLDLVFIVGLKMGVAGAAIATDISQLVSCLLSLRFLLRVEDDYRVRLRDIRLHGRMALRIIRVGLPTGIQNMVISFSNVLVQASVNSYGAAAMAGFAAYMKVDGFNILPVSSISMAATTFVGQNYGAGRLDRVRKSVWVTVALGVCYTLTTGALLLLGQDPIMRLFTTDEAVIAFGCSAMRWFCPFYFLLSILHGLAGAVRGTGASVPPMVVLLVSLCLFRILWIQWILPLFGTYEGVMMVYPVSWALGAVLMILYTWKGRWMEYHT
ncbi:MAG: MATE family efflux transporter [Faecalibacterium prausnitzii]|nr:MATE family efflux transporter [Faecalibacterium prausnitzii]